MSHLSKKVDALNDLESDLDEQAIYVPDLDDLDDTLFKSKRKPSPRRKPHVSFEDEPKQEAPKHDKKVKKPTVDDFDDWDDPLADILSSDESEVTTKATKKSSVSGTKKTSVPEAQESPKKGLADRTHKGKSVANLFGLDKNTDEDVKPLSSEGQSSETTADKKELSQEGPKSLDSYLDRETGNAQDTSLPSDSKLASQKANPGTDTEWSTQDKKRSPALPPNRKQSFLDDSIDLPGLGLDSDKGPASSLLAKKSSPAKQSLLDDLFGSPAKVPTSKGPKRASSRENDSNSVNPQKADAEDALDSRVSFGEYAPSLANRRESRRQRQGVAGVGDLLGLFSPSVPPQSSPATVASLTPLRTSQTEEGGDWLGVPRERDESQTFSEPRRISVSREVKDNPVKARNEDLRTWLGSAKDQSKVERDTYEKTSDLPAAVSVSNPPPIDNVAVLQTNLQADEDAAQAFQQQEQQLMAMLQMKQHEIHMTSTQQRQNALLERQEKQMALLLTQQIERQKKMERQLELQQQRISAYMQALVSQSPIVLPQPAVEGVVPASLGQPHNLGKISPSPEDGETASQDRKEEVSEMKATLKECEKRRKALKADLEEMQTRFEKQIHLMEKCYRHEIALLEEDKEKQEHRLRAQIEKLEKNYESRLSKAQELQTALVKQYSNQIEALQNECHEKLAKAQEQQALLIEEYTNQIAALRNENQDRLTKMQRQHETLVASLQKDHQADLDALKQHHAAVLEHLKQAQQAETTAIKETTVNLSTLQNTVDTLERNTGSLNEVQKLLQKHHQSDIEVKEASIRAKEVEVEAYRESLSRQREAAEEERRKLLSLVEQLELQVAEQRARAEEERFTLRQDTARLEARIQAFEKEKERLLAQLERERQQLEQEKEQRMAQIEKEHQQLEIERERMVMQMKKENDLLDIQKEKQLEEVKKQQQELEKRLREQIEMERQRLDADKERLLSQVEKQQKQQEKERERLLEYVENDRLQHEKLRQTLVEEQKVVIQRMKEEKMTIARERAQLEALQHELASHQEQIMQMKVETEVALHAAKEATQKMKTEKAVAKEQLKEIEVKRRKLQEQEVQLGIQFREADVLMQKSMSIKEEGEKALAMARQSEEQMEQKTAELVRLLNEIKERQAQVTQEKIGLSVERRRFYQSQERRCIMCRNASLMKISSASEEPSFVRNEIAEANPEALILKYVAEKDRDSFVRITSSPVGRLPL